MQHGVTDIFHIHTVEYYAVIECCRSVHTDMCAVFCTVYIFLSVIFITKKMPLKVSVFVTLYYASIIFMLEIRHTKTIELA